MSLGLTASPTPVECSTDFGISVKLHLLHPDNRTIDTEIYRVSNGLIELFSPVYIKQNQLLAIESEGHMLHATVAFSRRHVSGIYTVAIRTRPDFYVRVDKRVPVDLLTKLQIVGSPTSINLRIIDLSPSGLGMQSPVPIPVGVKAKVQMGYRIAVGQIKHCGQDRQLYRAGLVLENLVRSSDANASVWTALNSGASNLETLASFVREIELRQLRSVALVNSLAPTPKPSRLN